MGREKTWLAEKVEEWDGEPIPPREEALSVLSMGDRRFQSILELHSAIQTPFLGRSRISPRRALPYASTPCTDGSSVRGAVNPIHARVDQLLSHDVTPLSNSALQCSQLTVRELSRMFLFQAPKQGFGRCIGIVLEPKKDLGPKTLERILASPPTARSCRSLAVSRPCFAVPPQFREVGKELIKAVTPRTIRALRATKSRQG